MKIYTAAFGYRDCDPVGHVAGKTPEECNTLLEIALTEEREHSESECDSEHRCECGHTIDEHSEIEDVCGWGPGCQCDGWEPDGESQYCQCDPDLWYVGPFEESLLEVVHNVYGRWEKREFLATLRNGPAYIPMP